MSTPKKKVAPVPEGFHTATPYLCHQNTAKALEWYTRAFGAEIVMTMPGPGGHGIAHAEIRIGNSHLMMSDEWPGTGMKAPPSVGTTTGAVHLYVADCDAAFQRAVKEGATVLMPPMDMFWGDRFAKLKDPFGHEWAIATHVEDVPPEELGKRAEEAFKAMGLPPKN